MPQQPQFIDAQLQRLLGRQTAIVDALRGLMPKFASPPRRSSRRAWLGTGAGGRRRRVRCDRNRLGSVQGRVRPIARTATRELRNACIEVKPELRDGI